eukprot:350008-Chlamydomonas_euryale.AAC.1
MRRRRTLCGTSCRRCTTMRSSWSAFHSALVCMRLRVVGRRQVHAAAGGWKEAGACGCEWLEGGRCMRLFMVGKRQVHSVCEWVGGGDRCMRPPAGGGKPGMAVAWSAMQQSLPRMEQSLPCMEQSLPRMEQSLYPAWSSLYPAWS